MPEATAPTPDFRLVKLVLARSGEHPHGEPGEGYDLFAPLDGAGRLDTDGWRRNREACRVRHFTADGRTRIGHLRRKPGGRWYFDYEAGEDDDEIGFRFGEERFVPGEYVSISHRSVMRTWLVAHVGKP